jgi:hypothetical protein
MADLIVVGNVVEVISQIEWRCAYCVIGSPRSFGYRVRDLDVSARALPTPLVCGCRTVHPRR